MNSYKWFSLKNYEPSKDPAVWADHIFQRLMIKDRIGISRSNLEPADLFLKYLFTDEKPGSEFGPIDRRFMLAAGYSKSVSELSIRDLYSINNSLIEDSKYVSLLDEIDELGTNMGFPEFDEAKFNEKEATPISDFYLSAELDLRVNVGLDDKTILDSVLELVRLHRSKLDPVNASLPTHSRYKAVDLPNRPFDERAFSNWYLYRVLPYYDLFTWSKLANVKLTNEEASLMLWPDGFGNDETIRKTTKKYVATTISWSTLNRLDAMSE